MTPTKPGLYWGRWHTPAPGTADGGAMCLDEEPSVHDVFENAPGELLAFIHGVEAPQPLSAFEWGEEVVRGSRDALIDAAEFCLSYEILGAILNNKKRGDREVFAIQLGDLRKLRNALAAAKNGSEP